MRGAAPLCAGLWLAATGCATLAPEPLPLSPDDPRPEALLLALEQSARERRSLRAELRLALDGPAGAGRSRQALALERPARLRVEVQDPLFRQTLAVLVTDAGHYDFFRAEDRHFERGPVYPGLLLDVARVELLPEEVVAILLGTPLPASGLRRTGAALLGGGRVRVDLRDEADRLQQRFDFDEEGRLRRAVLYEAQDVPRWEVSFDDYRRLAGGQRFAHEIEIRFPASAARASLRFRRVELNPELPASVFVLEDPSAGGG